MKGSLYQGYVDRFREETSRSVDDLSFSEQDLVNHFKGQSREIKRYILDAACHGVISDPDNKLRDFIDFGGRPKEAPLRYSTIEKTFYSFFVYQRLLRTSFNFRAEEGENPRMVECSQILKLMNLIAEEIYIDKFDPDVGAEKIECRLQRGEEFKHDHPPQHPPGNSYLSSLPAKT